MSRLGIACLFLLFSLLASKIFAYDTETEKLINEFAYTHNFNGSLLIARDGKVQFIKSYGYANAESNHFNTANTKFLIGSISKQITATAILKLAEQNKLNVNLPISHYLTDLPEWGDDITIHNLLTHSSGIPDYIQHSHLLTTYHSPWELVDLIDDQSLKFSPGSSYAYSNINYVLLGLIVESVTHVKLEEYLKKNIFNKVGMYSTSMPSKGSVENLINQNNYKHDFARGHSSDLSQINSIDLSNGFGAGNVISTVHDLHRWNEALFNGEIISKESVKKMITPHITGASGGDYGYGIKIAKLTSETDFYFHGGRWRGFVGFLAYIPQGKISIVMLTNLHDTGKIPMLMHMGSKVSQALALNN